MAAFRRVACAVVFVSVFTVAGPLGAQHQQTDPQVGQPGKDVVWVPTAEPLVEKMLDLARVTAEDYVIDLGSGDGRTVIAAARRGARALGVEYEEKMVALSRQRAAEARVSGASFVQADLFDTDLSPATVITMFLLPSINLKLRPRLLDLKPGTRIVSNTFRMDDWTPDQEETVADGCSTWCTALLWIVPAKVEGTWRAPDGSFALRQHFQMLEGTLTAPDGTSQPVTGKLRGAAIVLNANGIVYDGRVDGDTIQGSVANNGAGRAWTAKRTGA